AEGGETRSACPLLHLGELDAARADVQDQEAALAAERILELRAQDPLDERMTAQTICERQGNLLLISPHPRLGLAAKWPNAQQISEIPLRVCAAGTALSKPDRSKLPSRHPIQCHHCT